MANGTVIEIFCKVDQGCARAGLARDSTRIDPIERRMSRAKGTFIDTPGRIDTSLPRSQTSWPFLPVSFDRFIVEFTRRNRSRRCPPPPPLPGFARFDDEARLGRASGLYTGPRGTNANHIHKLQAPWQIVAPDPPPFFYPSPAVLYFLLHARIPRSLRSPL